MANQPLLAIDPLGRRLVLAYLAVAAAVFLLMMSVGLAMRLGQGAMLPLGADLFYQLMTMHAAALVGACAMAGAAIMWYFLSRYVRLTPAVLAVNLATFLIGAVMILGAVIIGKFGAGWTFLYPLPAKSGGQWEIGAAAVFMGGLLVIGTGFLLLHLDCARAILARYGSLARGLGWPLLFRGDDSDTPPPAVVASTMAAIANITAVASGAAVLGISIANLYFPEVTLDPLLAKNLIYFFGHTFVNVTIYMAVIAVYEILPLYTGRPWKPNRVFLAAWTASTVFVIVAYPHHLLMDFAMPHWVLMVAQVISFTSGIPVLIVTAFGALTIVHRSGIRWDVASGLLMLSMFGWAGGVIPAIVDAVIVVNKVMHNTMWVPGHFHFYLLLGMVSMAFAFMYFLNSEARSKDAGAPVDGGLDRLGLGAYLVGGLGFVFVFLYSGQASVPRRWAAHMPEWLDYDRLGALFAAFVVAGAAVFVLGFLGRLRGLWARA
ncbi:MAG: cbb3-type cytochrome c oxidase subunit I [Rhodospirillales bacterium]|nr:cbb3-type cytochrome c oxidase subunit I [Rhodospirillales bacterium]